MLFGRERFEPGRVADDLKPWFGREIAQHTRLLPPVRGGALRDTTLPLLATRTDADGAYVFRSLRPGWYLNGLRYRTSHLHVKVFLNDQALITSQIYFPDDPFNSEDGIFAQCAGVGDCTMVLDANGEGRFDFGVIV